METATSHPCHDPSERRRVDAVATLDHAALIERARNRDPAAVPELVRRFRPLVDGVARRHCRSATDAEDVAQEVWIALVMNIDRIRSPACLPGWLQRVTLNAVTQAGRRARAVPLAELPEVATNNEDALAGRVVAAEERASVRRALGRLRDSERELMELLMQQERPDYLGISTRTHRPVGSIGPTRGRLLRRLRQDPEITGLLAS